MAKKALLLTGLLAVCILAPLNAQNFHVYISDAAGFQNPPWKIFKFDENGANGEVFIADHLAWPQDILFLENENAVLISNLNNGRISKFNATTGVFINEFATGIGAPTRIKIGPDGLLYVLQWQGNGKVKRYNLDGTFVDDFTAVGVTNSIGLDWDDAGNLYVSSYNGKYVKKFSPTGADLGNFVSTNLSGPTNIWFGENGDLFVIDYIGGSVKRFDGQGNYLGVFISGLPQGEGVDFFPNGNIIIGSGGLHSVRIYDASGNFLSNLVPPGTLGLQTPNAVVLRPVQPPSNTREVYKELTFVTPTVGNHFQIANPDVLQAASSFAVYDSTGVLVSNLTFAGSASWDASNLPAGVYYITAKLKDGAMARQSVVVQH